MSSFCSRVVGAHAIRDGASDPHIPLLNKLSLKLESAQLSWSEGGVDSAIRAAKHVVQAAQSLHRAAVLDGASGAGVASSSSLEDTIKLLVDASCLAAEWMSKSHSEASSVIQSYLKEASQVLTASQANSDFLVHQHHRCFYQLACFMDRLFQTLYSKSQSSEHEAARAIFHGNEEKIRQLNESMQDPQVQLVLRARDSTEEKIISARQVFMSKQLYIRRLEKEHAVDAQQNQLFDRSLAQALEHAILNYANCLRDGDKFDTQVVYRLIALWFNHYAAAPCHHTNAQETDDPSCMVCVFATAHLRLSVSLPSPPQTRPRSCLWFVRSTRFRRASSFRSSTRSPVDSACLASPASRRNRSSSEPTFMTSDTEDADERQSERRQHASQMHLFSLSHLFFLLILTLPFSLLS